MVSPRLCHCIALTAHVFFLVHIANATKFNVSVDEEIKIQQSDENDVRPQYIALSSTLNQVFGMSSQGEVTVSLRTSLNVTTPSTPALLTLCQVSDVFVRGPDYQRRQNRRASDIFEMSVATETCQSNRTAPPPKTDATESENGVAWCISQPLKLSQATYKFSVSTDNLHPNELYMICVALCLEDSSKALRVTIQGHAEFQNPDLLFPQLGFEEALFPVFSGAAILLIALPLLLLTILLPFARCRQMPIRSIVLRSMCAMFLKLLGAVLTFTYFFTSEQTGRRSEWYLFVRLLLASSADIFFIITVISISTGYAVLPNSWFVDEKSPVFLVYIAIVLQLLIVITVKVMFPFKYLGAVTYIAAGGSLALIACKSSSRISRFLPRYGNLIERSHIFPQSTPLRQLRFLYGLNIWIVLITYIFKMSFVLLFDYRLHRPDLLWGTMEITDAILLVWAFVWVFPHSKSALYVDMSTLSNARLHQAQRWRGRQQVLLASNETNGSLSSREVTQTTPEGTNPRSLTATTGSVEIPSQSSARLEPSQRQLIRIALRLRHGDGAHDRHNRFSVQQITPVEGLDSARESPRQGLHPQPPWISWTSSGPLPRPTSFTWRGRGTSASDASREEYITPILRKPIVVGSPKGSFDVVRLTAGIPVTGPDAIPKVFDGKGAEVADSLQESSEVESPTATNERNPRHGSADSRLGLPVALRIPLRRHNRANRRQLVRHETRRIQTQGQSSSEAENTQNHVLEADETLESDQISDNSSSSTAGAHPDGRVSSLGDG